MQQPEFKSNGYKKNDLLQIRIDKQQRERLQALASASGFKSLSDYIRVNLLNPSQEAKLNRIIELLEKNKSGEKNE